MTLTHDEIAALSAAQVDGAIAVRRDEVENDGGSVSYIHDYCGNWSHAGRLLEEMATQLVSAHPTLWRNHNEWVCQAWCSDVSRTVAVQHSHIAPEAIARCWLEWWEVTHE